MPTVHLIKRLNPFRILDRLSITALCRLMAFFMAVAVY